ncbi:hypothetical protein GCM10028895_10830 [Pontibacter rugosus]
MFKSILVPLAFSFLFALLLLPLNRDMEKWKIPRPLAIVSSIVLVVVILSLVVWFLSSQLMDLTTELDTITGNFETLISRVQDFLQEKFGIVPSNRTELITNSINGLQDVATNFWEAPSP